MIRCKMYCINDRKFICDKFFKPGEVISSISVTGDESHAGHGIFTFFATYPKGVNFDNHLQCWKCLQIFESQQDRDYHQWYCTGTKNAVVD